MARRRTSAGACSAAWTRWPRPARSLSALAWASAIALGIACTGIAYVLYFRVIANVGPTRAMAVTYLIPIFGMMWGGIFLGESLTVNMALGCAIILAGVALTTKRAA